MKQQRQSSRDSHSIHAASAHREPGHDSHRHEHGNERTSRRADESENPVGVLAELQWGREG